MFTNEIDAFEAKAKELMNEAWRLSRENDSAIELPQPQGSIHHLIQLAVIGFVSATKILVFVFRRKAKMAKPGGE